MATRYGSLLQGLEKQGVPMPDRAAIVTLAGLSPAEAESAINEYRRIHAESKRVHNPSALLMHLVSIRMKGSEGMFPAPRARTTKAANMARASPSLGSTASSPAVLERLQADMAAIHEQCELDNRCLEVLNSLSHDLALEVLEEMLRLRLTKLSNPSATLMSLIRQQHQRHDAGDAHKPANHADRRPRLEEDPFLSGANTTPVSPARQWSADMSPLVAEPTPASTLAADMAIVEGIAGSNYHQPSTPQSDLVQYLAPDASSHTKSVRQHAQSERAKLQPAQLVVAAAEGHAVTDVVPCSDDTLKAYASNACFTLSEDQLASGGKAQAGMQRLLAVFNKRTHVLYGLWAAVSSAPGQHGMQVEFEKLPVQAAVPQSTCLCLLDYGPQGFCMPQELDIKRTQKLLRALILAKLAAT